MDVLGVLISISISAIIILAFRYSDRNSRSIEKAKKYIDGEKDKIDAEFNKQVQQLNAVIANVLI